MGYQFLPLEWLLLLMLLKVGEGENRKVGVYVYCDLGLQHTDCGEVRSMHVSKCPGWRWVRKLSPPASLGKS